MNAVGVTEYRGVCLDCAIVAVLLALTIDETRGLTETVTAECPMCAATIELKRTSADDDIERLTKFMVPDVEMATADTPALCGKPSPHEPDCICMAGENHVGDHRDEDGRTWPRQGGK